MLSNFKATKVLIDGSLSNGEPRCAQIKMRMAGSGKLIHRNRFQRRNILLSLSGKMWWLSIDCEGGVAAQHLGSTYLGKDGWFAIEGVFTFIFSVEFAIGLVSAESRKACWLSRGASLNYTDVFSILPWYFELMTRLARLHP